MRGTYFLRLLVFENVVKDKFQIFNTVKLGYKKRPALRAKHNMFVLTMNIYIDNNLAFRNENLK